MTTFADRKPVCRRRLGWLVLTAMLAGLLAWLLYQQGPHAGWLPPCWFHRLTGLACPGCGMTRAVYAALHGHLAEAVRFNPLGMLLLVAGALWLVVAVPRWLLGKPPWVLPAAWGRWPWWCLAGVVVGYGILRNCPVWPLTLLVPP